MKNEKFISLLPLETERLIINPTSKNDIDLILKMDKQEETQKFLGGIKNKTYEERISFLEKKEIKLLNNLASSLTIYLKQSNIPIGFVELKIDDDNNNAEISFIFDIDYTKKGYCYEASKKLMDISFNTLKLNKIYADTIEGNEGSQKVLAKLGFVHEGTRRKHVFNKSDGKFYDLIDYGILQENYK